MAEPHFAVASTFSPRFHAVLAEADRFARRFGARLSVLHAAERSDEKVRCFQEAFAMLGREEVDIYWCEGPTPADALVDAAASEYFDLLIAGALEKENEVRNFTGGVARELLRRAPCDLLLLPDPSERCLDDPSVCLMVEASRPRWQAARGAIGALRASEVLILAADNPFSHAREAALGQTGAPDPAGAMVAAFEAIGAAVEFRPVRSNTGFMLCEIVQETAPDFLVVEADWRGRSRWLPPHLDWLAQVIPARLLLLGKPPRTDRPADPSQISP